MPQHVIALVAALSTCGSYSPDSTPAEAHAAEAHAALEISTAEAAGEEAVLAQAAGPTAEQVEDSVLSGGESVIGEGSGIDAASPHYDIADDQVFGALRPPPETCTWSSYSWSVEERRAVNRRSYEKPYAEVSDDERDPEDPRCTVCSEDQVEIDLASLGVEGIAPIRVCWVYAESIEAALAAIVASGEFDFTEITGYRPGRTRGRVVDGLRQELSNHSFGAAIDVNADRNGLYGSCDIDVVTPESIGGCDRRVGGDWDPERHPRETITVDSVVYRELTRNVGWRWGGEIEGRTRDMMHFSITGY